MALNFPNSPTDGQVFGAYTWTATRGVWLQTNMSSRVVTTSDTAPAAPSNGDMWMYTVDGTCFIYYNDGTSGQWVEQSKTIMTPATYTSPNYVMNGALEIWQRGTGSTTNTFGYYADRWTTSVNAAANNVRSVVSGPNGSLPFALRHAVTNNIATVAEYVNRQFLETQNIYPLAGNTVTLSFWYRSNRTGTHAVRLGNSGRATGGTDAQAPFTVVSANAWERKSVTLSTFATTTAWTAGATDWGALLDIGFKTSVYGSTSLTAGDYFEMTGVQLELGTIATPFRRHANSYTTELETCQRYYNQGFFYGVAMADNDYSINAMQVIYRSQMRINPTVTITGGGFDGHHGIAPTSTTGSDNGFYATWSGSGYRDIGARAYLSFTANADL